MSEISSPASTILIIENDRTMAVAVRDVLAAEGHTVLLAYSGEEALSALDQTKPDLIILDLLLGKLSGVDLLKKIRQDSVWGKNVPVVILSGVTYLNNMKEVKQMANKYIFKGDFELSDLTDVVRQLLMSPKGQ